MHETHQQYHTNPTLELKIAFYKFSANTLKYTAGFLGISVKDLITSHDITSLILVKLKKETLSDRGPSDN